MEWGGVSALVAGAALVLSLYNTREIKRAPERARQNALWDELRSVLASTWPLVEDAEHALQVGRELSPCPEELRDIRNKLRDLGPRFTKDGHHMHPRLSTLEAELSQLQTTWQMAVHHEEQLAFFSKQVDEALAHNQPDIAKELKVPRDAESRHREASHRELDKQVGVVRIKLAAWKDLLDARDRGEATKPGWQSTGPAINGP